MCCQYEDCHRGNQIRYLIHGKTKLHLQLLLDKTALLIQHGFDASKIHLAYNSDEYTFISILLDFAWDAFDKSRYQNYRNSLLGLLYESGCRFKQEAPEKYMNIMEHDRVTTIIESLKCKPLTLTRLAANVIRIGLQPNCSVVGQLTTSHLLQDIITMKGHPLKDYNLES